MPNGWRKKKNLTAGEKDKKIDKSREKETDKSKEKKNSDKSKTA
jgi:hypothetical protein